MKIVEETEQEITAKNEDNPPEIRELTPGLHNESLDEIEKEYGPEYGRGIVFL